LIPGKADGAFEPLPDRGFHFSCHKSVACFNVCCRDLHLVLTPYDVLRLKNACAMDSSSFLEEHTTTETDPGWRIPVVKLKMSDDPLRSCPFVRQEGCSIYEDRPGACRTYPLGRASRRSAQGDGPQIEEKYFIVRESHCLGFGQEKRWTVPEWLEDQGLTVYNPWNDRWMEFLSRYRPGLRNPSEAQWRMFYLACYSLDRFREFVFRTRLFSLIQIPEERVERIRRSEEELLAFAFEWLGFSIFGDRLFALKPGSVDDARP